MWRVGSLFSGIGGIEKGFEDAGGFETEWFVECEPYAQAVLKKHWPNVPCYGDIRKIDFSKLAKVDILTGGFPCQDISNAGKRKGISGEKSGLWKEYLRAISEIRPRIAFIENVSALLGRGLDTVLCDLAEIGYDADWYCLSAAEVGAPHKRERIWIIAMENSKCNGTNEGNWNENDCGEKESQHSDFVVSTSKGKGNVADSNNGCKQQKEICSRGNAFGNGSSSMADCDFGELSGGFKDCVNERESKEAFGRGSGIVAYANKQGVEGKHKKEYCIGKSKTELGCGSGVVSFPYYYYYWEQCKEGLYEKNRATTWATDAGVLRVAHGIPYRVDRIKCLGNAVVPACSEFFAQIIKERLEWNQKN